MAFLSSRDRGATLAAANLAFCNPFLPERIELEQKLLGKHFIQTGPVWSLQADQEMGSPNLARIGERVEKLAARLRDRLEEGAAASREELLLYEDLALYLLYHKYREKFHNALLKRHQEGRSKGKIDFWEAFLRDARYFLNIPGLQLPHEHRPEHFFACCFQVRRAFHHIYRYIVGGSMPAARLRATVWQSIFSHDMRRFYRGLYEKLGDFTTLITGESGTGKELVARAIGLSRYIPFDPGSRSFESDFLSDFHPLNISSLPANLVESELFGHRRGAFTGAVEDRIGWLEICGPLGSVFLDEVGELTPAIQVKLLRVLQARTFQRIGDSEPRRFHGKIIAATNRDLDAEVQQGHLREDFYYRLCSDIVQTPPLRAQLADSPGEIGHLVRFLAERVAGEDAEQLGGEVIEWIEKNLGADYPWPGNFRELEQCVRNILVRREYRPLQRRSAPSHDPLIRALAEINLTADELLGYYCTVDYASTGNYQETARRLKLDRRTVKSRISGKLLGELRKGAD